MHPPGELREIDGGGGLKGPAATPAREKRGCFPPITGITAEGTNHFKQLSRRKNFPQMKLAPFIPVAAEKFSHSLAPC
jgi:hypothetical protein